MCWPGLRGLEPICDRAGDALEARLHAARDRLCLPQNQRGIQPVRDRWSGRRGVGALHVAVHELDAAASVDELHDVHGQVLLADLVAHPVVRQVFEAVGGDAGYRPRTLAGFASPAELDEPLLDAWLEPGDVLYVPIGFPHATSTEACDAVSCHVTLGLDTYFYGLCYATLRAVAGACGSLGRLPVALVPFEPEPVELFR